jgi:cytochrome c
MHLAPLLALSLLAACEPPPAAPATGPSAGIESDIDVTRPARPPVPGTIAAQSALSVPMPAPAAAPGAMPPSGPMPGGEGIGLAAIKGPGDPRVGRSFALDNCRPCHVVARDQASPIRFANAPNFQDIAARPKTTPFSLSVWLTNPHPTMPTLQLTPEEASNVIAYILSLRS